MASKAVYLCLLLVLNNSGALGWDWDLFRSLRDGVRDLEAVSSQAASQLSTLLGAAGEASREELEDYTEDTVLDPDSPQEKDKDADDYPSPANPFAWLPQGLDQMFGFGSSASPWWQGKNVCVERETKEEKAETEGEKEDGIFIVGAAQFSSCKHTPNSYTCTTIIKTRDSTKTSTTTYQCCHGYRRKQGKTGCVKVKLEALDDVASAMNATRFLSVALSSGQGDVVKAPNTTVFLPEDQAWATLLETINESERPESNEIEVGGRSVEERLDVKDLVAAHIVEGLLDTSDVRIGQVVRTINNSTLRFTTVGKKLGVNCVLLGRTDVTTESGLAHQMKGVLAPVNQDIATLLSERYPAFVRLLKENDMMKEIENDEEKTVLAVSDEVIEKEGKSAKCLKRILGHHIMKGSSICSNVKDYVSVYIPDVFGVGVIFSDKDGKTVVDDGAEIQTGDIMATDGVVHQVSSLSVPDYAGSVSEALTKANRTLFLELLQKYDLLEKAESAEKLVLFVPPEEALRKMTEEGEGPGSDALAFHVNWKTDDGELATLASPTRSPSIRSYNKGLLSQLTGSRGVFTAECTRIGMDTKVCNGAMYLVDDVMTPPKGSIYDLVQSDPRLKALKAILNGTKLEGELKEGLGRQVTLLAPSEEALTKMGDANYDTLLRDKSLADQILRAHVVTAPVCCSGVSQPLPLMPWSLVRTLGGSLTVGRAPRDGPVAFGGVQVSVCDVPATDGVLHIMDGVMLPAGQRRNADIIFKKPNSEIILTGF